ncbi:ABC transporter ATP-binding protein [Petralouisia muris]|jgi:ATP-binding cassette subfamily B protein|uniref:ABC transporter ATP-binding protein n=1 Tax=Petralouisia muris TaxID=3032872 RepID=A0AC61S0P8_9FIRM|nr:ABC transporter ATP-binding protein [Petralouisia muris]TGY97544.1 ABC transporter ATP-binding protein [Petralouisia muris]
MWKYIRQYLFFAVIAGLFMVGEVLMDLIQPGIMSRIVDDGVLGVSNGGAPNLHLVWMLGLEMIGLVLFGGLCGSLNNAFVHISSQNIGNEIRKDCFRRIMAFSFPQLDRFGTGSLVTRVTNDITQVQAFVSLFVRGMIRTSLLTFGSMYCMFRLNLCFGLIVLCAFPFLVGVILFCLWKANPLFSRLQAQLDFLNGMMQEDVSGIRIIKACVREAYEKLRFGKANGELIKTQLQILVIFAFMNPLVNGLMYMAVTVILLAGGLEAGKGAATPGTVMAAITYATQLLNGILMLVMLFQNISRGAASWKRVREILESVPELVDGSLDGTADLQGEIEFRNVSFSYPGSGQNVLSHINLTIHKGETVAVMGATGCGKTSLVNLIPRFYDAAAGTVLVDGIDVKEYRQEALREKIAIAMQKSELFCMTVGENIAWGLPGAEDRSLEYAASIAQADRFIASMEQGYGTAVAERGMSLSGGQKQRISIARAVVKPAEIYIFDDSTSALDLKTEAEFYRALKRSRPDSTKIIIAQRIASVRTADRIVVLENGGIAACGTHEELLISCQAYQEIYHSQIGEEARSA